MLFCANYWQTEEWTDKRKFELLCRTLLKTGATKKRATSAKLADILAARIRRIMSKFRENIYTNSFITYILTEQYTINQCSCQRQMHDLFDVEDIFPCRTLPVAIYFNSLSLPTYQTRMGKFTDPVLKFENPHSAINYLSYKSPGIMQILWQAVLLFIMQNRYLKYHQISYIEYKLFFLVYKISNILIQISYILYYISFMLYKISCSLY